MEEIKIKSLSESLNMNNLKYSRTIKGIITNLYSSMRRRARIYNREILSKSDFLKWLDLKLLKSIFENYQNNWYLKKLKPSIDRINNNWWYIINNIQLITWEENYNKSRNDLKKRVVQKDINNNIIKIYNSLTEASSCTNITNSCISRVCNGERKLAGNYKWEYERC